MVSEDSATFGDNRSFCASGDIFIQSGVADSQIDCNSLQKDLYYLKLTMLQIFYCLEWNILLTGVVYLIIDTYSYFITPMHKKTYSLTY